jgi:hypothetical protein
MIYVLKCYIALQFWRLPQHDIFMDNFLMSIDFKKTRNVLLDNNGNNVLFEYGYIEQVKKDKNFRYYFRCFILPYLLFNTINHDDNMEKWRIYNTEKDSRFSFVCSDMPIIYNNVNDLFMFKGNILFPLTKNRILLVSEKTYPDYFPAHFWANINMFLYEHSNRYLAVLDKHYLNELQELCIKVKKETYTNFIDDLLFQFV